MQVAPSRSLCALAKIILFAIALSKVGCIKQPHFFQAGPAYVHAKPHPCGDIYHRTRVGLCAQFVHTRCVITVGQFVVFAKLGVTANRGVV